MSIHKLVCKDEEILSKFKTTCIYFNSKKALEYRLVHHVLLLNNPTKISGNNPLAVLLIMVFKIPLNELKDKREM